MSLTRVLGGLALASDVGAGLAPESSLRTAVIAVGLARSTGLTGDVISDIFHAALLRHIGCTSSSHEETTLMGDDLELKQSLHPVDAGSIGEIFDGARRGFARGQGSVARLRSVARFMVGAPRVVPIIFGGRCEVAIRLAARLSLSVGVARALDETYERHDGKGLPRHKRADDIGQPSKILAVAEVASTFSNLPDGNALAIEMVGRRAGGQLDPQWAAEFRRVAIPLLAETRQEDLWERLLASEPGPPIALAGETIAATVFADFSDLKSPYTLGHSRGVARLAARGADALGLPKADRDAVECAALLHDVGRVSVSNAIWDKPGPLSEGQWDKVRMHPLFTERIVRAAGQLGRLSPLASSDHERVGAPGYPRGVAGEMLVRLLAAADVYQALTEPRAYRPARSPAEAARIVGEDDRLDRKAVQAVLAAAGHVEARPANSKLTEREFEVVRLLARGLVDKEIAHALGISTRTVHHHNQHIYDKIGVRTRSGIALFAVENGLL